MRHLLHQEPAPGDEKHLEPSSSDQTEALHHHPPDEPRPRQR